MSMINILAGPAIGSLIGYVTNYLAVKMLFRPLHPLKIGRFRLPFTPGIFPKRKEELAKALGRAVGNNLLTADDIESMFLADEMKASIAAELDSILSREEGRSIKDMLIEYFQENDYLSGKAQLERLICERIAAGISKLDLKRIIVRESSRAIKEKTQGTMLALMANDRLIASLVVPVGEKVEAYINENGQDIIRPIVQEELNILENRPIRDHLLKAGLEREQLLRLVDKIYTVFIREKVAGFIQRFDIAGVVEQKVNAMDVLEIEKLVLSVMKRELNAIVNLGALIGLLIGTIVIFL